MHTTFPHGIVDLMLPLRTDEVNRVYARPDPPARSGDEKEGISSCGGRRPASFQDVVIRGIGFMRHCYAVIGHQGKSGEWLPSVIRPFPIRAAESIGLNIKGPMGRGRPERKAARMCKVYGYAKVSSKEQNLERQPDALEAFGLEEVFADKASGKDFDRPERTRLLGLIRPGDVLVIKSIDRFGRDYEKIIERWKVITKELGAFIVVLDMPILDTKRGPSGALGVLITDIVLQVLSFAAQNEREGIRARQAEGIASARARGVKFGRPRIEIPEFFSAVSKLYLEHQMTRKEVATKLGVSPTTFDRWLKEACGGEEKL